MIMTALFHSYVGGTLQDSLLEIIRCASQDVFQVKFSELFSDLVNVITVPSIFHDLLGQKTFMQDGVHK